MQLPPEVIKLLDADATPEIAARDMQSQAEADARECVEWLKDPIDHKCHATTYAGTAYHYALAAAAIRAMEEYVKAEEAWGDSNAWRKARDAYMDLRGLAKKEST